MWQTCQRQKSDRSVLNFQEVARDINNRTFKMNADKKGIASIKTSCQLLWSLRPLMDYRQKVEPRRLNCLPILARFGAEIKVSHWRMEKICGNSNPFRVDLFSFGQRSL